jgi:hypothetical protein
VVTNKNGREWPKNEKAGESGVVIGQYTRKKRADVSGQKGEAGGPVVVGY